MTMQWDDGKDGVEIGGKTVTPATIRLYGDETLAQKYIGVGRTILGSLKQQMDLGGLKAQYTDVKLEDGTKIRAKSNMWGLADIDEIWIDVITTGATIMMPKELSVVGFHAYCSTFLSGKQPEYTEQGVVFGSSLNWYMYEPIHTSGGYIRLTTSEESPDPLGIIKYDYPNYLYSAASFSAHGDAYYLSSDVDTNIVWPDTDYRDRSILINYGYRGAINVNDGTQTAHGLYCVPENCFAHVFANDDIDRFKDSTISRFSCHPATAFDEKVIPSPAFYNDMQLKANELNFYGDNLTLSDLELTNSDSYVVPKRSTKFLEGWYALTVSAVSNNPTWNPSDTVQSIFVVERDDGSKITHTIDIPIEMDPNANINNNPSRGVIMINPKLGKLRKYILGDRFTQNTFVGRTNFTLPDPHISGYMGIDFAEVYKDFIVLEIDLLL